MEPNINVTRSLPRVASVADAQLLEMRGSANFASISVRNSVSPWSSDYRYDAITMSTIETRVRTTHAMQTSFTYLTSEQIKSKADNTNR